MTPFPFLMSLLLDPAGNQTMCPQINQQRMYMHTTLTLRSMGTTKTAGYDAWWIPKQLQPERSICPTQVLSKIKPLFGRHLGDEKESKTHTTLSFSYDHKASYIYSRERITESIMFSSSALPKIHLQNASKKESLRGNREKEREDWSAHLWMASLLIARGAALCIYIHIHPCPVWTAWTPYFHAAATAAATTTDKWRILRRRSSPPSSSEWMLLRFIF
ncbi:uncharacterized protein LOC127257506 [Andrographis paniculata]|uniref:uncharacterized protein LOC127257506 n=1 Tax=Andrographis paniculata TaxID=175694 RepID=UPI0021E9A354|nr:uncharacterized protein LOC127257506 [Andrographis paniculata]